MRRRRWPRTTRRAGRTRPAHAARAKARCAPWRGFSSWLLLRCPCVRAPAAVCAVSGPPRLCPCELCRVVAFACSDLFKKAGTHFIAHVEDLTIVHVASRTGPRAPRVRVASARPRSATPASSFSFSRFSKVHSMSIWRFGSVPSPSLAHVSLGCMTYLDSSSVVCVCVWCVLS